MVKYEILEKYGVIGRRKEGDLELRLIAWDGFAKDFGKLR